MTLRRGNRRKAQRLRAVVDCLPYETRLAMLEGLRRYDRIIVGAYTDRTGGVCPMLAAHRCGGRTDFRSFARAWDGFTGAGRRARRASERELRTLTAQLEASLWEEDEWRADMLRTAPPATRPTPAEGPGRPAVPDRERAWLGPFRRWDRYRDAVRHALGRPPAVGEGPDRGPAPEREQGPAPEREQASAPEREQASAPERLEV